MWVQIKVLLSLKYLLKGIKFKKTCWKGYNLTKPAKKGRSSGRECQVLSCRSQLELPAQVIIFGLEDHPDVPAQVLLASSIFGLDDHPNVAAADVWLFITLDTIFDLSVAYIILDISR